MFLHKFSLYLIIFLITTTATAVRKIKRPVKPAKTYPRTNATPAPLHHAPIASSNVQQQQIQPQSALQSTIAGPIVQQEVQSQQQQQQQQPQPQQKQNVSVEEGHTAGNSIKDNELPKPMESNGNVGDTIIAAAAIDAKTEKSTTELTVNGMSQEDEEECDPDMIGFEIITGYVLSAPSKMLDTLPGTLMLTDCLEACQINESCSAVNYETGLCVLFKTTADKTPGSLSRSQFPVFTIYAQKSCLGIRPCSKAWCIDRVQGYRLVDHVKSSQTVYTRRDCLELCLGETEFTCRSANYYYDSGLCELSDMDRITLSDSANVVNYEGADYLENNCAEEPSKLCEFKRISGKILKTVDSVYQDINSIEECRDLCLNSPYRCHSYDYNDTGEMVCRLSHHARSTLTDVTEPYLDVPEAATYELSSCYNVSIECRSGEMITKIRTSKIFDGKVYAKGAPKSCAVNVNNSLEFDFRMGYNDLECNVRQSANGRYMNDIVIQHHDMIVTSSDLGLAVSCQYDLTNKTVSNEVDLGVTGEIESSLSEEIIIDSPNVIMKITSRDGSDMKRIAEVGDPLALRFEIVDPNSPYEIFVRELVALDGTDNAEITLIDASGCPTDQYIMGAVQKYSDNRKVLVSQFDAFKFPSSEVVQFRALVTPCIPHCPPVKCNNEDSVSGELKTLISYGRRRRRSAIFNEIEKADGTISSFLHEQRERHRQRRDVSQKPANDNILLVQSIQITDKFGFNQDSNNDGEGQSMNFTESTEKVYSTTNDDILTCLNGYGLIIAGAVFLLAQLIIVIIYKNIQKRMKKERYLYAHDSPSTSINYAGVSPIPYVKNHQHHNQQQHQQPHSHHLHQNQSNHIAQQQQQQKQQKQRNHIQNGASDTLGKLYDSGITGRYGQNY